MSKNLPDKHNRIKSFKCVECQLVFPESSRFQDKAVCVTCVAEAGYKAPMDETDNKKEIVPQEENKAVAETKVSINMPEQKVEIQITKAVDTIAVEKEIVQQEDNTATAETEVSVNMPEQEVDVQITKAVDAITIEKNTKNEHIMSITMVEETDWVTIAAGEFMMGSLDADEDSDARLHDVTVSGFKILKTAVTFEQFDVFCKETGKGKYSDCKWGRGNRPVVFVNYWDAADYAKWLSDVTGWQCRLPTEAEWEYACRAGTETTFNTGNTISTAQANYDGDSPHLMISKGISRHKTMPTGTFPGNAWGLFEMHGNVYEWCASEHDPYYNGSEQLDGSIDRSNDVPRVLRGGSWNSRLETLRSAARMQSNPENRSNEWGFRLVRVD